MKFIFLFFGLVVMSCNESEKPVKIPAAPTPPKYGSAVFGSFERPDFKKFYDEYGVSGTLALYNAQKGQYILYNAAQFQQGFSPASTFKICNSLIGLETGVIADENFVLKWDGTKRRMDSWNKDHTLATAFQNSTVWYYQELARRVGKDTMKHWLDTLQFGNADTTGGVDMFWLSGGLLISPEQQIDFLWKLQHNQLPFSQRSMDIVKNIMIADTLQPNNTLLRAKTGWSQTDSSNVGWYVGYLENDRKEAYYFANCLQSDGKENPDFGKARKEIVLKIMAELGWVKNEE